MTFPNRALTDRALADERAQADEAAHARDNLADELAAAQQQAASDRTTIAARDATIAEQAAQILDLRAQLAAATAHVVYGSNIGGYWKTLGEKLPAAHARIKAGYGRLPAVRVWTQDGTVNANYLDDTCQLYMCELGYGMSDQQLDAAFARLPKGAVAVPAHEPENPKKGIAADAFRAYLTRVGAAHVRSKRDDVTVTPMLMGITFDPKRAPSNGYKLPWTAWIPNPLPPGVNGVGADLYPWSKDTAAYTLTPAIEAAKTLGVRLYVGEFGCGHQHWTDQQRATYTTEAFDLFDRNAAHVAAVCVYEDDNGANGPWNLLPLAAGKGVDFPLTAAVVRDRINRTP